MNKQILEQGRHVKGIGIYEKADRRSFGQKRKKQYASQYQRGMQDYYVYPLSSHLSKERQIFLQYLYLESLFLKE
jgi:hypothetical protein